ncbi:NAD-dependent protein deacylase [Peribacillus sp. SCS-37]|uniref:NAD-dependent protein deacylase n=1 Tax=Paraperibacillus esterisolvens TaxID=3115296 RepID=UPI0039061D75
MNDIEKLTELIRQAESITFLTGAGISTESNLPDFRSSKGLWTNNQSFESLISRSYYKNNPAGFWKNYKEIFAMKLLDSYEPNRGHEFITFLQDMGKNVVVITQNIDGLHEKSGTSRILEVHGTLKTASCLSCSAKYDLNYINEQAVPRCSICGTILKPDVVLFGDPIHHWDQAAVAAETADLFLVMGSSLEVGPVNFLPAIAHTAGIPMAIINKERTQSDDLFDIKIHAGIGETVQQIREAF